MPSRFLSAPQPVHMSPNSSALPGSPLLQRLADGIDSWALIASMIGVVIGAVIWAFGHYSQNYQQAYNGRKGVMVSGLAALLMGAAPMLISALFTQGSSVGR